MIRVAVVEDEARNREQINAFLKRFGEENNVPINTAFFTDGMEIADTYTAAYDIIFLDIVMPKMDGMSAARRIRQSDENVIIIFITNMAKYAINGYEVGAMDYVLKPLNYGLFSMKMKNALRAIHRKVEKTMTIKQRDSIQRINVSDIYYIEVDGHYLSYHTARGVIKALGTLKDTEAHLQNENFVRCSNYFLVNLKYVSEVSGNVVVVANDGLQISRSRKKELLQAVAGYIGEM